MRKTFFTFIFCLAALFTQAATINYTADDNTIFKNPERGFITMLTGHLTTSNPYGVKGQEGALNNHANNDQGTIILVHYYLDSYKNTATLPAKILNGFDEDMAVLRSKGMKAIIRFSYVDHASNETANDAPWNIVQQHINQYASHWQENADVIFCFQAGIVGAWGEWYYTSNYGNKVDYMNNARRQVVDAMLAAVPADRCIQLRTPKFKTTYMNSNQALTEAEAWQNTAKARLGQHNDAFLYDYDNMGTYQDTATEKPWLAQETLYVPIGGETDITDVNKAKIWATYEKTTAEMSRLHWTFIQSGYATQTTNYWRGNGTFDELNRKMGYRYQLVNATLPEQATAGGKVTVKLNIKNTGYAPLYNERHAYIVLKNGSTSYQIQLAADPRKWKPNGVVTAINEQITIPSNAVNGTYQMYLYMPDAYASIASNPAYAIRFANANIWEATTGMNKLNASITISGGSDTPEPPQPTDAIQLPAMLDKTNVTAYSENMTWFNTNYFDFGPNDAANLDSWAEWNVYLRFPGEYNVSMVGYYPNGHEWQMQLLNSGASTFGTERTWTQGDLTENGTWDLTNVAAGIYTLRVQNVFEWSQPKLQSINMQYNGELPSTEAMETAFSPDFSAPMYDILGRPVNASYKGIVIQNGNKYLLK